MRKSWKKLGKWIIATPQNFGITLAIILLFAVTGMTGLMVRVIWTNLVGPLLVTAVLAAVVLSLIRGVIPGTGKGKSKS